MTVHYVDASAWSKLLVVEAESRAFGDFVESARDSGEAVVSAHLLSTELHRLGVRLRLARRIVQAALDQVSLILPDPRTYHLAGILPGQTLRSLDALHIATAIEADANTFISYDARQQAAAREAGLHVTSPGALA